MAVCPECEADIEIDEYDVDKGEIISCPECGVDLEVVGLSPLELDLAPQRRGRLGGVMRGGGEGAALDRRPGGDGVGARRLQRRRGQRVPGRARPPRAGPARPGRHRGLGVAGRRRSAAMAARVAARVRLRATASSGRARSTTRSTRATTPDRCYHCKTELFRHLLPLAARRAASRTSPTASSRDDLSDFRPGRRAAAEAGVRSPLAEAGLDQGRRARAVRGPWACPPGTCRPRPACPRACPTASPVTPEVLRQVERAEAAVRALGFREFRVRHLGRGGARRDRARGDGPRWPTPPAARGGRGGRARRGLRGRGHRPRGLPPRPPERGPAGRPILTLGVSIRPDRPRRRHAASRAFRGGRSCSASRLSGDTPHPAHRGPDLRHQPHPRAGQAGSGKASATSRSPIKGERGREEAVADVADPRAARGFTAFRQPRRGCSQ